MKALLIALLLSAGPRLEAENAKVVAEGTSLCQRSGCQPCGLFSYLGDSKRVVYGPSYCELMWLRMEEGVEKNMVDAEIRAKYGKK